ncbi:MAG: DUF3727 domain-containing protein [Prochlorococcus sp. MED-G73]|jgi:hypothetical protein|uniref:DUF3727 domain-containing protein n=2 Tax=Prochlorococcaceae TaxID=2881426 RepID=UPI0004F74075|nr:MULTISPECIES: DUF3727 domain-containing protein [Prochlorococcus]AIQ96973.1 hypothetical protein EW15_0881 [Prochlorococcus sp. MIT 0801]MBW3049225.1 DUF3727 domain-containing protein [Prochlorococcus marinus str. MU1403]PYE02188.1 DUF3727 domain-containing protein [Prochlorococcus marinus XMU1403]RCL50922.1 MAG: DUF3727 domain-containing protein [Prochlorococcus sp. MED-G73]|tara:strand:- start:2151 stop:2687 length:537 start_codon:yes stop_codon:yes gene_type:complete
MSTTNKNDEVPTLLVKDSQGSDLLCFLEQVVPLEGNEYALLTPVDTPVSLFQLIDDQDPKLIETIEKNEPILEVADVVLQEHDLRLVRSAITLTVSGELDEPEPEEIEEEDIDDESETYELLVNFRVESNEYGLYIPLDPFFIVGKLEDGEVKLVEGEEFDKIQSGIEAELEERGLSE